MIGQMQFIVTHSSTFTGRGGVLLSLRERKEVRAKGVKWT